VEDSWRRGRKYRQKTAFFECSRIRNFYITIELELKIHMKNINIYMYMCTNFQEHLWLGIEDISTHEL